MPTPNSQAPFDIARLRNYEGNGYEPTDFNLFRFDDGSWSTDLDMGWALSGQDWSNWETVYVSPTGDDNHAGDRMSTAKKTLSTVISSATAPRRIVVPNGARFDYYIGWRGATPKAPLIVQTENPEGTPAVFSNAFTFQPIAWTLSSGVYRTPSLGSQTLVGVWDYREVTDDNYGLRFDPVDSLGTCQATPGSSFKDSNYVYVNPPYAGWTPDTMNVVPYVSSSIGVNSDAGSTWLRVLNIAFDGGSRAFYSSAPKADEVFYRCSFQRTGRPYSTPTRTSATFTGPGKTVLIDCKASGNAADGASYENGRTFVEYRTSGVYNGWRSNDLDAANQGSTSTGSVGIRVAGVYANNGTAGVQDAKSSSSASRTALLGCTLGGGRQDRAANIIGGEDLNGCGLILGSSGSDATEVWVLDAIYQPTLPPNTAQVGIVGTSGSPAPVLYSEDPAPLVKRTGGPTVGKVEPAFASEVAPSRLATLEDILITPREVYPARRFGIVPDAVLDQTSLINAALVAITGDGGGDLAFEPGVYRAQGILLKDRTGLMGAGAGRTTIKAPDNGVSDYVVDGQGGFLWLSRLTIDGNAFDKDNLLIVGGARGGGVRLRGYALTVTPDVVISSCYTYGLWTETDYTGTNDIDAPRSSIGWSIIERLGLDGAVILGPNDSHIEAGYVTAYGLRPGFPAVLSDVEAYGGESGVYIGSRLAPRPWATVNGSGNVIAVSGRGAGYFTGSLVYVADADGNTPDEQGGVGLLVTNDAGVPMEPYVAWFGQYSQGTRPLTPRPGPIPLLVVSPPGGYPTVPIVLNGTVGSDGRIETVTTPTIPPGDPTPAGYRPWPKVTNLDGPGADFLGLAFALGDQCHRVLVVNEGKDHDFTSRLKVTQTGAQIPAAPVVTAVAVPTEITGGAIKAANFGHPGAFGIWSGTDVLEIGTAQATPTVNARGEVVKWAVVSGMEQSGKPGGLKSPYLPFNDPNGGIRVPATVGGNGTAGGSTISGMHLFGANYCGLRIGSSITIDGGESEGQHLCVLIEAGSLKRIDRLNTYASSASTDGWFSIGLAMGPLGDTRAGQVGPYNVQSSHIGHRIGVYRNANGGIIGSSEMAQVLSGTAPFWWGSKLWFGMTQLNLSNASDDYTVTAAGPTGSPRIRANGPRILERWPNMNPGIQAYIGQDTTPAYESNFRNANNVHGFFGGKLYLTTAKGSTNVGVEVDGPAGTVFGRVAMLGGTATVTASGTYTAGNLRPHLVVTGNDNKVLTMPVATAYAQGGWSCVLYNTGNGVVSIQPTSGTVEGGPDNPPNPFVSTNIDIPAKSRAVVRGPGTGSVIYVN